MKTSNKTKKRILTYVATGVMIAFAAPFVSSMFGSDTLHSYADTEPWDGSVDIAWFTEQPWGTEDEPSDYTISTPAELAGLAYIVNGRLDMDMFPNKYQEGEEPVDDNLDVSATVADVHDGAEEDGTTVSGLMAEDFFNSSITEIKTDGGGSGVTDYKLYVGNQAFDFAGKTIHIANDLDLGGIYQNETVSGPNWVPIGGRFPVKTGSLDFVVDSSFNGTIEGGFHTIDHIYCNRHSGADFMMSQGIGLIGSIGTLYDDASYGYGHATQKESVVKETILDGWTPVVRNLCMGNDKDSAAFHGSVYGNRMVGALIGRAEDTIIENCANFTSVKNTDHKGIAGIAGTTSGKGVVRNCYNAGYIYSLSNGCPAGGIVGSNGFSIYNCYNVGRINVPDAPTLSEGIGSHLSGNYEIDNCFSLSGTFSDTREDTSKNGYYFGTAANLVINTSVRQEHRNQSEEAPGLKDPEFISEINANGGNVFVSGTSGRNHGYPLLFWQAGEFDPESDCTLSVGASGDKGGIAAIVPAGGYTSSYVVEAGDAIDSVPVGTVIQLESRAEAPNVLQHFTANGNELRSDFYTLTEDAEVDGAFITLESGVISIPQSSKYEIGISKNGTVLDKNDKAWSVKDYVVSDGDTIFQGDILTVKAVMKKGTASKDKDNEYTGSFNYTFRYSDSEEKPATNTSGIHTVDSKIGTADSGVLTITATPRSQSKTWATYADTSWAGDTEDIRGNYEISTAEELAGLAKLVNAGESFEKATILLTNDVSLKNPDEDGSLRKWEPIGGASNTFKGTFDGGGHRISGMQVRSGGSIGGLFGYCTNATIKNLTISGSVQSVGNAGGIASIVRGGTIEDCTAKVTITSTGERAGGITSQLTEGGTIKNCISRNAITGTSKVGGIAGEATHTAGGIEKCANYGKITGTETGGLMTCTGGLVGYLGCSVQLSYNMAAITSANTCVGGLAGFTYANTKATEATYKSSSALYNCINVGDVEGSATKTNTFVGGLVGRSDYLLMKNCFTTGSVSTGDPDKTYLGTVVGGFYKSIFSDVSLIYYSQTGSPATSYTKSWGSIKKDSANPTLDYFKTACVTEELMKAEAFTDLLNQTAAESFVSVPNSVPQLAWIAAKKDITVTYTGAFEGTDRTWYGGAVDLPECEREGYKYEFTAGGNVWDGTGITENVSVAVTESKIDKYYVIFTADNKKVDINGDGEIDKKDWIAFYPEDGSGQAYTHLSADSIAGDSGITEAPPVDAANKEGYTAGWDWEDKDGKSYWDETRSTPLGFHNIKIPAVYTQRSLLFEKNDDGEGTIRREATITAAQDGYFFLAPQAKGTITVKNGAQTTLDGENGSFTNLRIVVEEGGSLTLKNMVLRTDPVRLAGATENHAVLEVAGGADADHATTVRFSGFNNLIGTNDGNNGKDNDHVFPAMEVSGYVRLMQASKTTDTLHITAGKDSPEINIENGGTLEVAGGIVEVYKRERLGTNGGMIYGGFFDYSERKITRSQKGNLAVTGGSLIAVSDSNNVFCACVDSYRQTGGQAIFYAPEACMYRAGSDKYIGTDVALYAERMEITGGSLSARTRSHQSAVTDPIEYYSNADAIASGDDFNSRYFLYVVDTSAWNTDVHTVTADGNEIYSGKGNNVSHPLQTSDSVRDKFSTKKASADPWIYLWLARGEEHTIAVDGETIAEHVAEDTMENVRYTMDVNDNTVELGFLDSFFAAADTGKKQDGKPIKTGTTIALISHDAEGNLQGFTSDHSFLLTDPEQNVTLQTEMLSEAHQTKLLIYDGEKTLRPLAPAKVIRVH